MPFLFIVCIISLKKVHIYPIAIVTAVVIYLIGGYQLYSLTNLLFLPLIAFVLLSLMYLVYHQKKGDIICLTANTKVRYGLFTLVSLVLIFVSTAISQAAFEIFSGAELFYDPIGWLIVIASTLLNTLLIGILAFPLQARFCKILLDLGI